MAGLRPGPASERLGGHRLDPTRLLAEPVIGQRFAPTRWLEATLP